MNHSLRLVAAAALSACSTAPARAWRNMLRLLALAACMACAGMGGALAQAASPVTASAQAVQLGWNQRQYIALQAADATPGGPYAITYAITSGPAHGGVFGNSFDPQAGTLTYQPDDDYAGPDSFTFTAHTVNGTSAPATVGITVAGPLPPAAYDMDFSVAFNTSRLMVLPALNPNLSKLGPNAPLVFELVTPPAHGGAVFNGNIATYTPTQGYTGPDSFTYRIQGQYGTSNTATVRITVGGAAQPVAQPGSGYVPHGTATPIALAAQDPNPGGPFALTYALVAPPAHGSVAVHGSTATYTPGSGPSGGYWGEDGFTFTATSVNGTSAPAAVRVLVGQPVVLGVDGALGDTGQTACTDTAGAAIACGALTGHPGQDGRFGRDAQAQAPAFDYALLGTPGSGCVQDRVTGLTWSDETLLAAPWDGASGAAYSRCGIASGWRLPTRRELLSLVHHGASNPASAFPDTQSAPYWSSDTQGSQAWAVDFADGGTRRIARTESHAARLVARPVNQAPTLTLGADIVLSNMDMPGPRRYPGWATGITPGPAREAGQQLFASVRLLPVPGEKTLEFDVPPAIDPATGDLTFTVLHHIYPEGEFGGQPVYYWTSSAGRVRVEVTLQDDGGTAGGGVDATVTSFEIALSPVPSAFDINIKHPWKASCIPVTLHAQDIDTDPKIQVIHPLRYAPLFRIKQPPQEGYLIDYVSKRAPAAISSMVTKSISVPLGDTVDSVPDHVGATGNFGPQPGPGSKWGFFATSMCYVPTSSTFTGFDAFSYTAVDVDGNESAPASVTIEIFEK